MKLTKEELAIVSKLIDLNYEYFQAKKMDNPIVNQINDNSDDYQAESLFRGEIVSEPFQVSQKDLVELRYKVEDFFNQKQRKFHIRVREERVGYYTVKAESLNEAEKKAHYNLRGEIGGEIIPAVDFEEFNPKDFQ